MSQPATDDVSLPLPAIKQELHGRVWKLGLWRGEQAGRDGNHKEESMDCMYCGQLVQFEIGRGWVHAFGAKYVQKCGKCGADIYEPTPKGRCPYCGSNDLRDQHCATPERS